MNELYLLFYGIGVGAWVMSSIKDILKEREIKKIRAEVEKEREKFRKLPEKCPRCGGEIKNIPAGVSKRTHQPYREFWVCDNPNCSFTANKKGGHFICRWDKSQNQKGRTSEEKSKARELKTKKEEAENPDEIRVEDIPF